MAYLNCPFCPSQGFPVEEPMLWVGGYKALQRLEKYRCTSKHVFYVEPEEDINGERQVYKGDVAHRPENDHRNS